MATTLPLVSGRWGTPCCLTRSIRLVLLLDFRAGGHEIVVVGGIV